MNYLGAYSNARLMNSMEYWGVTGDFAQPIFSYLVYGYHPGSFFNALLANDAINMLAHSHPANSMRSLTNLAKWIRECMPREAYGSYDIVDRWFNLSEEDRIAILISNRLVYEPKVETMMALKGVPLTTSGLTF